MKKIDKEENVFNGNSFKNAVPWLILVLGIILFFIGYVVLKDNESLLKIIIQKISDILIIGVLIGFITDCAQFMGVFRKELISIIYDSKFLGMRKDIEQIWENVSKILFESKFQNISHNLMTTIKKNYLSKDAISYYNNYVDIYEISWVDKDNGIIKIINKLDFSLHTDSVKDVPFNFEYSTCCKTINTATCQLTEFSVNGIEIIKKLDIKQKDDEICYKGQTKLKGSTLYKIKQSITKIYSINEDNYLGFKARFLINDMRVQLFLPEDIDIKFLPRGTSEDYILKNKHDKYLEYHYKGLILRNQGFIIILNKK